MRNLFRESRNRVNRTSITFDITAFMMTNREMITRLEEGVLLTLTSADLYDVDEKIIILGEVTLKNIGYRSEMSRDSNE